jgi:hypothetical protein
MLAAGSTAPQLTHAALCGKRFLGQDRRMRRVDRMHVRQRIDRWPRR